MSTKELLKEIGEQMAGGHLDKQTVVSFLEENYKADSNAGENYDELAYMMTLVEKIDADKESEIQFDDMCRAIVYCIAIIEARKRKIDISKVKKDFEIKKLAKKYIN